MQPIEQKQLFLLGQVMREDRQRVKQLFETGRLKVPEYSLKIISLLLEKDELTFNLEVETELEQEVLGVIKKGYNSRF